MYNIFLILLIGETGYTFNSLRKIRSLSSHSLWTIPGVQIQLQVKKSFNDQFSMQVKDIANSDIN